MPSCNILGYASLLLSFRAGRGGISRCFSPINRISEDEGLAFLDTYYVTGKYTGSYFETIGAAQRMEKQFTGSDLYTLCTLSVDVPVAAGISILNDDDSTFNGLFGDIRNISIGSLSDTEFVTSLGQTQKHSSFGTGCAVTAMDSLNGGLGRPGQAI